jgi:hypothetical protein
MEVGKGGLTLPYVLPHRWGSVNKPKRQSTTGVFLWLPHLPPALPIPETLLRCHPWCPLLPLLLFYPLL